ncbi:MAG: hypothetical protein LBR87_04535 [Synergistaceae bacterium]|jgi:hypothetical protein|nr:hypothetical protein [Synergistaceae bacterium]
MAEAKKTAPVSRSKQMRGGGEPSSKKLLRIVLLVACCAGSVYFFWTTMQLLDQNEAAMQDAQMEVRVPDPVAEKEKKDIEEAEQGLSSLTRASSQAMRVAFLAEVQSKFPLDIPMALVPSVAPSPGSDIVIEPDPPMVTVVAIMITDADRAAIVSIDGEDGVLVRQGTKFSGGSARITKIDARSVTFTWMRKSYQVSL